MFTNPIRPSKFGRLALQQPFKSHTYVPSSAMWSCKGQQWPHSFTQLRAQRFTLSTYKALAMSLASPQRVISECLKNEKHDKWGWVIYRTTYDDDEGWTRLKQFIIQQSHDNIDKSDAPEIADSLEWTFVEDRATLDGASKEHLRSRFKKWASETLKTEQPRVEDNRFGTFGISRYTYFIDVDEGALKSVVYDAPQPPEADLCGEGYVNFIDADWKPLSELASDGGDVDAEEEDVHEPIDGCTEENVGWMRIAPHMVGADFYQTMMGYPDVWYVMYQRPPEIRNW